MSQDEILNLIHQKEKLTAKEITQKLKLGKSTVSKQLQSLRKKKLIRFKKSKNSFEIQKY